MQTEKECELTYISDQLVLEAVQVEQSKGHLQLILVVLLNGLMRAQQFFTKDRYEK